MSYQEGAPPNGGGAPKRSPGFTHYPNQYPQGSTPTWINTPTPTQYNINPYAPSLPPPPPGKSKRAMWVLIALIIVVLSGTFIIVTILRSNAENQQPKHRLWTYCTDIQRYNSSLGTLFTNDLINATMTLEQFKAVVSQHGGIAKCYASEVTLSGSNSAIATIAYTFADGMQITQSYTLKHVKNDDPGKPDNNWRIDAQGWKDRF